MSKFSIIILIVLAASIQFGISFGVAELLDDDPYYSSEQYGEDMARIFCMSVSSFDLDPCADIPVNSNPEFQGISDVKLLQNFFIFSFESTPKALELKISSDEFWLSDDIPNEEWNQQYVSDMKKMGEITSELSSYMEELQYRDFVFESIYYFDESCEVQYDILLHEPKLSIPQSNSTEIELIKWLIDDKKKFEEWILMLEWAQGPALENVESDIDKQFFSEFYSIITNLDEGITNFQDNRNQQSLNQLRNALEDLENFSNSNKEIMILSEIDFDDQTSILEVNTQMIPENYFESFDSICRKIQNDEGLRENPIDLEIFEVTQEQTTLSYSLEFIEYRMDTPPSPYVQLSYGVSPESVTCKDNFELILKPNMESSVCVTPKTNTVLIQRGWISPEMI